MSAEQLAEIQEKFSGTWKVDRSECFEDFLREVGVNSDVRKEASLAKSTYEVKVDGETITVSSNAGFVVTEYAFKLGEEFEEKHLWAKTKTTFAYEDGKLVSKSIPADENIKPIKAIREIIGDEMLLTIYIGVVVGKIYYERTPK